MSLLPFVGYQLSQFFFEFLLVFIRVAAFLAVLPLLGSQMVPTTIRLILAILLTVTIYPLINIDIAPQLSLQLVLFAVGEFLTGVAFAFLVVLFFHIFALAGQLIALQMGLGFASMIDPANGVSVPIVSQFFSILVGLLFLASGSHLLLIEALIQSYLIIPLGFTQHLQEAAYNIYASGTWLFASALLLALPAVVSILIVNLAFGVMTRSAPQLNIFSLGFPFTLIFGVFILWVSMAGFLYQYTTLSLELFERFASLL